MLIYLIRHGQTAWNHEGRFQGNMETELTPAGIRQAETAGRWLRSSQISELYASDLKRALHTAWIINDYLKARVIPLPALREIRYGEWEGKTWREIERGNAAFIREWLRDRINIPAPGGESFLDLQNRLAGAVARITASPAERVGIVTHEGVLKTLICLVLGIDLAKQANFSFENGSVSRVRFDRADASFRILSLNESVHSDTE